ncbi:MAG: type II toxin-antitoxin system RelE/ParE family toxin [Tepidiphilus sp.]|jgi:plasmid stabilization system protein ParE
MAAIELAPEVAEDFERILDHLALYEARAPDGHIRDIIEAFDVLEHNPRIGRPVRAGKRELIIGRSGKRGHGYIALYRYIEALDTVIILAIRSQREAGYRSPALDQ